VEGRRSDLQIEVFASDFDAESDAAIGVSSRFMLDANAGVLHESEKPCVMHEGNSLRTR
jgi:hypothetical protein